MKKNTSCGTLTHGAAVQNLAFPDIDKFNVDIVLGYQNVSPYETLLGRMGAVIERYTNRIGNARFELR